MSGLEVIQSDLRVIWRLGGGEMGKTMIWEGIRGEIREIDKDKAKTR